MSFYTPCVIKDMKEVEGVTVMLSEKSVAEFKSALCESLCRLSRMPENEYYDICDQHFAPEGLAYSDYKNHFLQFCDVGSFGSRFVETEKDAPRQIWEEDGFNCIHVVVPIGYVRSIKYVSCSSESTLRCAFKPIDERVEVQLSVEMPLNRDFTPYKHHYYAIYHNLSRTLRKAILNPNT